MKYFLTLIMGFFLLFGGSINAQSDNSYDQVQTRFYKIKLSTEDSLAFKEAGILKAKTLFEYGDVYLSNSNNRSNQTYVTTRVPDLFYVPEGDTLNTDSVVMMINTIIENEKPNQVEIVFTEKEGVLGHVATATQKLNFEADIILVKTVKKFGKSKEKIWQVFLTNPEFNSIEDE